MLKKKIVVQEKQMHREIVLNKKIEKIIYMYVYNIIIK